MMARAVSARVRTFCLIYYVHFVVLFVFISSLVHLVLTFSPCMFCILFVTRFSDRFSSILISSCSLFAG